MRHEVGRPGRLRLHGQLQRGPAGSALLPGLAGPAVGRDGLGTQRAHELLGLRRELQHGQLEA